MTLAQDRPGPPPRPRLHSDVVPPWLEPTDVARPVAAGVVLASVVAAAAAGLAGLAAAIVDSTGVRQRLTEVAGQGDPAASEALLRSGVRATLLLLFGAQVVLALLLLLWLGLFLGRRAWARWTLLATGVLAAGFALLTQGVVAGGPDLDRTAFLAEAAFAALVVVALLLPSLGSWLRGSRR